MQKFILALRIIAAVILLQTLWFKFSAAPESVAIFTKLGAEPYGRIFAGVCELIAGILLLIPFTQVIGGLMAAGIMVGALLSHIFVLGISVDDDHGLLFGLATLVLVVSLLIVFLQREKLNQLPVIGKYLK